MSKLRNNPDLAAVSQGERVLTVGSRGETVRAVQRALLDLGFELGDAGVDGIFGPRTQAIVRRFQVAHGLAPSGEINRETLHLLDSALDAQPEPSAEGPHLPEDYLVRPIADLRVLDARSEPAARHRDIRTVHPEEIDADIVTSGTFHAGRDPVGPLIQGGRWMTPGGWPHGRGGVAVLDDGTIRIGLYAEPSQDAVRGAFATSSATIREFMGGGALIIKEGVAVSSSDLEQQQRFRGGGSAPQFEATARHTIIGLHADGTAYLVIDAGSKSLQALQEDLILAGFRDVVMFDGGNAFGYEDTDQTLFGRVPNSLPPRLSDTKIAELRGPRDVALTGFAIKTR